MFRPFIRPHSPSARTGVLSNAPIALLQERAFFQTPYAGHTRTQGGKEKRGYARSLVFRKFNILITLSGTICLKNDSVLEPQKLNKTVCSVVVIIY